jgi:glucan phosphoethanolaminetransferase (alkaline phosphatase superfamily)
VKISTIINDAKFNKNKIPDLKVVLIIGESARAMNFEIDGYQRKTTPRIMKIKNFISFHDVSPCANLTSYAVSCMLSGKTEKDFFATPDNSETIIKLFEDLSFKTAWFSTQKAVGDNNTLLFIGTEAQKYIFKNTITKNIGGKLVYDEYLLNYLSAEISDQKDEFVVLHTEGSHFLFDERYPENFKVFTPTCSHKNPDKCSRQSIINSYDNSILYTDYFIAKVIEELKDKNAILFYVSDHGQFLGENGIYYHGNFGSHKSPEHKVPMFLWMSDGVLKNPYYRHKFNQALSKTNNKLSHDNLFDSLLDCAGIDSKILNRNLSVCR